MQRLNSFDWRSLSKLYFYCLPCFFKEQLVRSPFNSQI
ncbi:hypothetical protein MCEMAEM4_03402 [Burkholderiaceae bacterium]